jgi:hypothetical protein
VGQKIWFLCPMCCFYVLSCATHILAVVQLEGPLLWLLGCPLLRKKK